MCIIRREEWLTGACITADISEANLSRLSFPEQGGLSWRSFRDFNVQLRINGGLSLSRRELKRDSVELCWQASIIIN